MNTYEYFMKNVLVYFELEVFYFKHFISCATIIKKKNHRGRAGNKKFNLKIGTHLVIVVQGWVLTS